MKKLVATAVMSLAVLTGSAFAAQDHRPPVRVVRTPNGRVVVHHRRHHRPHHWRQHHRRHP